MLERIIMLLLYPLIGLLADNSLHVTMFVLGGITMAFLVISRIPRQ